MDNESSELMELVEEVPLKELTEAKVEISAWLMKGSRKLVQETRGSILEGTICYS